MAGSVREEVPALGRAADGTLDGGDDAPLEVSTASLSLAAAEVDGNAQASDNARKSYRILGTHPRETARFHGESESDRDSSSDSEGDPMAWADLEAFGGDRKTLAKKKPLQKLTREEVRQQLAELEELDHKMDEGGKHAGDKHRGIADTIAWLKRHNESSSAHGSNQKRKRSSVFVRSVLGLFSRSQSTDEEDEDAANNKLSDEDTPERMDSKPRLREPWGQAELAVDWTELGFCLLNQPIYEDMNRVRAFVEKDELMSVSPQGLAALGKWLQLFDQHVRHVSGLKEYLLEERTLIAGVGYKVTTLYDAFDEALAAALAKIDDDRRDFGDSIMSAFAELETILKDEVIAVKDVISQTLTEPKEYAAITALFSEMNEDDANGGVVVAKLLGWMKANMKDKDVRSFLALFRGDVRDRVAGEWMRQYAAYLHLLDEFSVNYDTSLTFFT